MQTGTLKIGVVEDELLIARTIINTLTELGYSHCGPAISYTEALEMLNDEKPDLLLLDINLSGKKNGIDVAEKVNELYQLPFIFLTANSDGETIERAKKVKPHSYIVKPFTKEELFASIEIAFSNYTASASKNSSTASQPGTYQTKDFLFVKDGYLFRKILFSEVQYLESDGNYVTVHLASNRKTTIRTTLNDFATQFDPKTFIRIHRSFLVNAGMIEEILPTELAIDGKKIPLGKSYRNELFKALGINEL